MGIILSVVLCLFFLGKFFTTTINMYIVHYNLCGLRIGNSSFRSFIYGNILIKESLFNFYANEIQDWSGQPFSFLSSSIKSHEIEIKNFPNFKFYKKLAVISCDSKNAGIIFSGSQVK